MPLPATKRIAPTLNVALSVQPRHAVRDVYQHEVCVGDHVRSLIRGYAPGRVIDIIDGGCTAIIKAPGGSYHASGWTLKLVKKGETDDNLNR